MNQREVWLKKLFQAIDNQNVQEFAEFLCDDVAFTHGNNPAVVGREEVAAFVSGFFSSIDSLSHSLQQVIERDDSVVCNGIVNYKRANGSTLMVPFCNWLTLKEGLVKDYRIFVDSSELYRCDACGHTVS